MGIESTLDLHRAEHAPTRPRPLQEGCWEPSHRPKLMSMGRLTSRPYESAHLPSTVMAVERAPITSPSPVYPVPRPSGQTRSC